MVPEVDVESTKKSGPFDQTSNSEPAASGDHTIHPSTLFRRAYEYRRSHKESSPRRLASAATDNRKRSPSFLCSWFLQPPGGWREPQCGWMAGRSKGSERWKNLVDSDRQQSCSKHSPLLGLLQERDQPQIM